MATDLRCNPRTKTNQSLLQSPPPQTSPLVYNIPSTRQRTTTNHRIRVRRIRPKNEETESRLPLRHIHRWQKRPILGLWLLRKRNGRHLRRRGPECKWRLRHEHKHKRETSRISPRARTRTMWKRKRPCLRGELHTRQGRRQLQEDRKEETARAAKIKREWGKHEKGRYSTGHDLG
jgi:hypothetical protein